VDELPVPLVKYGATDSILSQMIAQRLLSLTMEGPAAFAEPPESLKLGSLVEICHINVLLPKAVYSFLEMKKAGGKCKSGVMNTYVGAGKTIIQIDDVLVPGYKPPICFKD
jgi:hypothetical protein